MNHQIHHWFDNARFALKPLRRPDDNSIVVQWHWLKVTAFRPKDRTSRFDSTASILESAGLTDKSWGACLAHRESGVPIRTGQVFTIRAEDAADLPSWDLLELSWNLLRVAAICGAANADDAYWDAPDDDDEPWPEHAVLAAMQENLNAMQEDLAARQQAYAARQQQAVMPTAAAGQGSAALPPPAKGKAKEEITGAEAGEGARREAGERAAGGEAGERAAGGEAGEGAAGTGGEEEVGAASNAPHDDDDNNRGEAGESSFGARRG